MKYIISLFFLCMVACTVSGQHLGIKTNVLYDATATINLGLEVGLAKRLTLDVSGDYNGWKIWDDNQLKHWMVQPELRLWLCEKFNGHFFGLHGVAGQYDIYYPSKFDYNRRGDFYGGGISWGYQWMLGRHWGLELTVGGGYMYVKYDEYDNPDSDQKIEHKTKNYWGLTKAGISFTYFIF